MSIARYAIYFAPSNSSALARYGHTVLQREPLANDHPIRLAVTHKASHYGFHATLKAPMELAAGCTERQFLQAVEDFSATQRCIELQGLAPCVLDGFHALTLPRTDDAVSAAQKVSEFAGSIVTSFEPFRAPLSEFDRARRKPELLSPSQRQYLEEYGYPYVLRAFRFHMTLSNRIGDAQDSTSYHEWLSEFYTRTVTETPLLDSLAVFHQPNRDAAFTRIATFAVN